MTLINFILFALLHTHTHKINAHLNEEDNRSKKTTTRTETEKKQSNQITKIFTHFIFEKKN